jgi:hypothetical protein
MPSVVSVLVFTVVLFFYLHIQFHLKTSEDLEVYELEAPSKEKLEEICDLRQPVRLSFAPGSLQTRLVTAGDTYGAFDVKVRDSRTPPDEDEDPYVPLRLDQALQVMRHDKERRYVTEANGEYLAETGLAKTFRSADPFLRPYMVASCGYDYMTASPGARTPMRYELAYRTYFVVLSGKVTVKLAPPKTGRYLYPVADYCNYEFRSPVDPWDPQPQYRADFDKAKCLDVVVESGTALFIPARWWYTIEFTVPDTHLGVFRYSTYMSALATCPHTLLWALQTQNVKHRMAAGVPQVQEPAPDGASAEVVNSHESVEDALPQQDDVEGAPPKTAGPDARQPPAAPLPTTLAPPTPPTPSAPSAQTARLASSPLPTASAVA